MTSPVEDAILRLLADVPAGKSIDPSLVARGLDAEGWRRQLPRVRSTAVGMARQGRLEILRHGKPADPDSFRGVYRLRLPLAVSPEAGDGTA